MKPLSEITPAELDDLKVVTFDVDGVIIPMGTQIRENEDGSEFYMKTYQLSKKFVDTLGELKKYIRINFSSGRSMLYLRSLVTDVFDETVILQSDNGAMTWIDGKIVHPAFSHAFYKKIHDIRVGIRRLKENGAAIRGFEPKMFIVTAHADEMQEIPDLVKSIDPEGDLYCVRGSEAYDIGMNGINKGHAIGELAKYLSISNKQIMTTGNHRNDAEMLKAGLGVTVTPNLVSGDYFIASEEGVLGGEVLADFLVKYFSRRTA